MRVLANGVLYFAVVFAAGFVLGAARELVLVPALGAFRATVVEAPLMLAVCVLAARWVIRRTARPFALGERAGIGAVAFAMLMVAEIAGAYLLRGQTFTLWLEHFADAQGLLSLGLFAIFALLPALVGAGPRSGHGPISKESRS